MKRIATGFLLIQVILFITFYFRYFAEKASIEVISDQMDEGQWRALAIHAVGFNNLLFSCVGLLSLFFAIYSLSK